MLERELIAAVLERLQAAEPLAEAAPRTDPGVKIKDTAFKSLVSCMLSAQSRDAMTARATASLFRVVATPGDLLALPEEEIAALIKDCGLYRLKARNLKRMAAALLERFGGVVPDERAALMSLPGVGRKSADIMLRFVFDRAVIAVDTHVFRVSRRLGLAEGPSEARVAAELEARVPERFKRDAHLLLLEHGKRLCRARRPRCPVCPVRGLCEKNGVTVAG